MKSAGAVSEKPPHTPSHKSASSRSPRPLRLDIHIGEAAPWPALKIRALALLSEGQGEQAPETGERNALSVPVAALKSERGLFLYNGMSFKADPLDALLVRSLLQLPRADESAFLAGAREFAALLALLRQCSPACRRQECNRVAAMEVLDAPPRVVIELSRARADVPPAQAGETPAVHARARYRCPETGRELGQPLFAGSSYWTFAGLVAPAAVLPSDPLLRRALENPAAVFSGGEALELLARAAGGIAPTSVPADEVSIQMEDGLRALPISPQPLAERVHIRFDERGDLEIRHVLETPEGEAVVVGPASVPAGRDAGHTEGMPNANANWVLAHGRWRRLPISEGAANFRLPAPRTLSGDAIADFLLNELPCLQAAGAAIDPAVAAAVVCEPVPSVRLSPLRWAGVLARLVRGRPAPLLAGGDAHPTGTGAQDAETGVQLQWTFEAGPAVDPRPQTGTNANGTTEVASFSRQDAGATDIAPLELLAAAAAGRRYLRRGNTFVRVDREAVVRCRQQLEQAVPLNGETSEARDEQVPELLALARELERDVHSPWNIYVAQAVDGAHKVKDDPASLHLRMGVEDDGGQTWFTLDPSFDCGGEVLSEEELRELVRKGRKWFRRGNTWIKVDSQALKKFDRSLKASGLAPLKGPLTPRSSPQMGAGYHRRYYRFSPAARDRVTDIFSLAGTCDHSEQYKLFLHQLRGFQRVEPLPPPAGLKLPLRSYQQQGFEWLWFLSRYGLNGILADDMGLGKTAQTLAQLARMKEEHGAAPSLIVSPTSLLDNWRNEARKFCPGLRVMTYRGSPERRDRLRGQAHEVDIVLGTYATVRNDASLLRQIGWRYVILDEAHFVKNSAAATTKAIKTIPARHRLALTGTPIQNRLAEIWSLFDFLMPEFLGRQARFRETYEVPIRNLLSGAGDRLPSPPGGKGMGVRGSPGDAPATDASEVVPLAQPAGSLAGLASANAAPGPAGTEAGPTTEPDEQQRGEQAALHLRERIGPFILRRLKADVAGELPPKIASDIFCTLCPEQVALYRSFSESDEARQAVDAVGRASLPASAAILAALTSLRKICNHADLMCLPTNAGRQRIGRPLPGYEERSGKLAALGELMEQCREGGHRALIFCQLTTMLDLLGHFLEGLGLRFLRLDGETPGTSRQGLVEQFNADASLHAFLISTRAGGAGLNLTGADTVVFYDHDWNPANDSQAQDRAHRIGQQRSVNVYRLICKGTLEEKILHRQALKRMLADSIVQHDLSGAKDLTREELLSLFTLEEN